MSLILNAPINQLGYGQVGYHVLAGLYDGRHDPILFPIGPIDSNLNTNSIQISIIDNNTERFSKDAPSIKIWHQNDLFSHVSKRKRIGFPIFELQTFDKKELASLNSCDKLFVCSEWAKGVVDASVNMPTAVVPLGVDTSVFRPSNVGRHDRTVFFNCGKWEHRKGHDILLKCFNAAFDHNDNVELWMMCENPFLVEETKRRGGEYKSSKLGDRIRLIPRQATHNDVYNVMKQVDCGVFPARAEGWNLELLELMACGKHVIATNYAGHTEFCNSENCMLIEIDALEVAIDNIWFHGSGLWAQFGKDQEDQLIEHMRAFHKHKCENGITQNSEGIITADKFTWANTVNKILGAL